MIVAYLVFIGCLLTTLGHYFVDPVQIIDFVVSACFDCADVTLVVEHIYFVSVVATNVAAIVAHCEYL